MEDGEVFSAAATANVHAIFSYDAFQLFLAKGLAAFRIFNRLGF